MRAAFLCFAVLILSSASAQSARESQGSAGIERLHQQIINATLSEQPEQITELWDENGVRITEVGAGGGQGDH